MKFKDEIYIPSSDTNKKILLILSLLTDHVLQVFLFGLGGLSISQVYTRCYQTVFQVHTR